MRKIKISLIVVLLCIYSLSAQEETKQNTYSDVVQTANGKVRGIVEGDVAVFKGIPYAAPPIGAFRWRPPQPVTPWEGELTATEYGANCAQSGWGGAPGTIAEGSSEDCLYLNLFCQLNL